MFRVEFPVAWSYHANTSLSSTAPGRSATFPQDFEPYKEYAAAPLVRLPAAALPEVSLRETLQQRASCRSFGPQPLELGSVGTLLHTGYGIVRSGEFDSGADPRRTTPSAGGLYPLEVYLLSWRVRELAPGVFHYHPVDHALEWIEAAPVATSRLPPLFLGQPYLHRAAALIVVSAIPRRSLWKYGDRGYRYALMEAGHVAQAIGLGAAALGVGCLCLGGFRDAELSDMLALDIEREIPLYAIAVGTPSAATDLTG